MSSKKLSMATFAALCLLCHGAKLYTVSTEEQIDVLRGELTQTAWIRPNDWAVAVKIVNEPATVDRYVLSTNDITGAIFSNSTFSVYWSLSADLSAESLDETASSFNPGALLFETLDGGTITNGNRFVATEAGTYRVKATSSTLGVRYGDIPLTQRQSITSNATVYVADSASIGERKGVNDTFLADLAASTLGGSGTADEKDYDIWWTVRCPCRPTEGHTVQGLRSRNALSPHLMVACRHYCSGSYIVDGKSYRYNYNGSYLTFRDPAGNTNVSVVSSTIYPGMLTADTAYDPVPAAPGVGFPLAAWAVENGWTRSEVMEMHIEDVMVIPVVSGSIPDSCCPYIMSLDMWREKFGGKGNLGAWAFSQTYVGRNGPDGYKAGNYMTPCILNLGDMDRYNYGANTWTCAGYAWDEKSVRSDIFAQRKTMEAAGTAHAFPPIYGGDSSGGIYIRYDGKWVLASMFTTIGSGASFSAALPVLKKLCQSYGDTLKTIEE